MKCGALAYLRFEPYLSIGLLNDAFTHCQAKTRTG